MSHEYLRIKGMAFRYRSSRHYIFKNINLTFSPGWTGVVGANGAGKSTLLQLAAGILKPVEGEITNHGVVVIS